MITIDSIFAEISIIIIIATLVAGAVHLLKQPLIIGHIITGLIVGPYFLDILHSTEIIDLFSQLGIALLLFIVGLSLSPRVIRDVGAVSLVTGVGQVVFTALIGYIIALRLGFAHLESLYIAIALTFSSTIIILKLLSDKKDMNRLYGKIATGFLLVQDVIAVVILILVSALSVGEDTSLLLFETFLKGAILTAIITFTTVFLLPTLSNFFARSQEFLFLFAMSWGLGLALLFKGMGFSIEIGALIAGVALATSPYNYEISSRLRPLRDFFIILFFILLGSQLSVSSLNDIMLPALIFTIFILIGNPLIVMIIMGLMGYNKKTGFKAGLTVAQISEFSLVLIALGAKFGHLNQEIVSLVTVVGLTTIAGSTYMILYSDQLYQIFAPILSLFERRQVKSESNRLDSHEIILFGYDNVGNHFIDSFKKLDSRFLVVDYDPGIIKQLAEEGVNSLYGDAADNELLDTLQLNKAKLIISTISDVDTNKLIIGQVRKQNLKNIVIVKSDTIEEASTMYRLGATYVMMPHYISGNHTSNLISRHGFDLSEFVKERDKHLIYLDRRREK